MINDNRMDKSLTDVLIMGTDSIDADDCMSVEERELFIRILFMNMNAM